MNIENTSLETHVSLCSERYDHLNARLDAIESQIVALSTRLQADQHTQYRTYLAWAGVIITSLAGTVVALILANNS